MAIQVNGTEVISNSRALNNIASIDATTAAAIGAAGVGGGTFGSVFYLGQGTYGIDLKGGTTNNTDIIVGGQQGNIYKSTDGVNFSNSGMGNTYPYEIFGMARIGSKIVTSNSNGRIGVSTNNGASFSASQVTNVTADFLDIATDGSIFVTVTGYGHGRIYTTDGTTTTERLGYSGPGGRRFDAVAHNGSNLWLAGGVTEVSGTKTSIIAYSSNGTSWSTITSGVVNRGQDIKSIAYGNGYWLVGYSNGDIIYSTNGTSWTYAGTVPQRINDFAYNDGLWVGACGSGQIITSEDPAGPWKANVYSGVPNSRLVALPHSIGGVSSILVTGDNGYLQYTS